MDPPPWKLSSTIFCGCRRIINESNIHDVLGEVSRVEFVSSAHVTGTRLHQPSIVTFNQKDELQYFSAIMNCT